MLSTANKTRSGAASPLEAPRLVRALDLALRASAAVYLLALVAALVLFKALFIQSLFIDPLLAAYGLLVCGYVLLRFVISLFYRPAKDAGIRPTVAVVMPAFNEEEAIAQSLASILAVDYPKDSLEVVVVDDGSNDGTLREIRRVARGNPSLKVIEFPENRGKRAAMAAGVRATSAEIVAFVDSDSALDPDAIYKLVQGFADPDVGGIAGHADVLNVSASWLTKMQEVRYFIAFKVIKASESVFGAVTCASGCFAAYRREAIESNLAAWEHQRFLGRPATLGDDRALTNIVLRRWRMTYEGAAVSRTIAPHDLRTFLRQQLRWKRSWTRESLILSSHVWRKHPIASISTYVGVILPLVGPLVALRALIYMPLVQGAGVPVIFMAAIYVMSLLYGFYYVIRQPRRDLVWVYGVMFVFFYLVVLAWQTYWAMATARETSWGTRGVAQPEPASAS
jgi:hyaluronan synthase